MQQSKTDWQKMDDKDINLSALPEVSPEKFAKAIVRKGLKPVSNKTQITLRLDTEVLNWFKAQCQGYQKNPADYLKRQVFCKKTQKITGITGITGVRITGNNWGQIQIKCYT